MISHDKLISCTTGKASVCQGNGPSESYLAHVRPTDLRICEDSMREAANELPALSTKI